MADPFTFPLQEEDFRCGAVVLTAVGNGSLPVARQALDAIRPGEVHEIAATAVTPYGVWSVTDDYVFVAISGTANRLQMLLNVLGSIQAAQPGIPGKVAGYFGAAAIATAQRIGPELLPLLPGRRLVLLGHSLGGAIVQILASMWGAGGCVVITYGCPRVGDAEFAASVSPWVTRIEDTVDPVLCLPPEVWAGIGSPWSWPLGIPLARYVHAGEVRTLDEVGGITDVEDHLSLYQVWQLVESQNWPAHEIKEYLRRLDQGAGWEEFGRQYDDPPQLDAADEFLLPAGDAASLSGGSTMLVQGLMYFRTTEESQGWSEAWYADTTVNDMLPKIKALIPKRAAFLSNSCEIFAYRAANVVGTIPAAPRLSRVVRMETPQKGNASALWGKVHPPAVETNMTMDAIDFLVKSQANGSRKVCSFRGIDDAWINGSALTDAGRGGLSVIKSYLKACKDAAMGMKVYDRNQAPKPMETVAQDAVTKLLTVTITNHQFANSSIVTIRGCKANPMINGRWKITVTDANTFKLNGSQKLFVNTAGDGTASVYGPTLDFILDYDWTSVSTRETGRPFGSRRGRRSARLLHH